MCHALVNVCVAKVVPIHVAFVIPASPSSFHVLAMACAHACDVCGSAFESRNKLFRHVAEHGAHSLLLLIGYTGRFIGSSDAVGEHTVGTAIVTSIRAAWGCDALLGEIRQLSPTERGVHSSMSAVLLSVRGDTACDHAGLETAMRAQHLWLLAPPRRLSRTEDDAFASVVTYKAVVPYRHLLQGGLSAHSGESANMMATR